MEWSGNFPNHCWQSRIKAYILKSNPVLFSEFLDSMALSVLNLCYQKVCKNWKLLT